LIPCILLQNKTCAFLQVFEELRHTGSWNKPWILLKEKRKKWSQSSHYVAEITSKLQQLAENLTNEATLFLRDLELKEKARELRHTEVLQRSVYTQQNFIPVFLKPQSHHPENTQTQIFDDCCWLHYQIYAQSSSSTD
jgi:hypothetical protein